MGSANKVPAMLARVHQRKVPAGAEPTDGPKGVTREGIERNRAACTRPKGIAARDTSAPGLSPARGASAPGPSPARPAGDTHCGKIDVEHPLRWDSARLSVHAWLLRALDQLRCIEEHPREHTGCELLRPPPLVLGQEALPQRLARRTSGSSLSLSGG